MSEDGEAIHDPTEGDVRAFDPGQSAVLNGPVQPCPYQAQSHNLTRVEAYEEHTTRVRFICLDCGLTMEVAP